MSVKYNALARLQVKAKGEFDEDVLEAKSKRLKELRDKKAKAQEQMDKAKGDGKSTFRKTIDSLKAQIKKLVGASIEEAVELVTPPEGGETDAIQDAKEAAEFLNKELVKLFPKAKYIVRSRVRSILGPVFTVDLYNVPEADANSQLKVMNASTNISLMMHLSTAHKVFTLKDGPFILDLNKHMGKAKSAGVKWRKISGATPMETAKKTLMWFKKNQELIESVYDAKW